MVLVFLWGFPGDSVKNLPAMREACVRFLGQEDPLEKEMATCSSILAWKIPWPERSLVGYGPWGCKESDMKSPTPLPHGGAPSPPQDPRRVHTPAFPSSTECPKLPCRESLPLGQVTKSLPAGGSGGVGNGSGDKVPRVAAALHTWTGGFQTWHVSVEGECLHGWNFTWENSSVVLEAAQAGPEVTQAGPDVTGADGRRAQLFQLPALLHCSLTSPFWAWAASSVK